MRATNRLAILLLGSLLAASLLSGCASGKTSPEPEALVTAAADSSIVVDDSCRSDADCVVKNVGNCCGYFPACVNVASPTDPEGVLARCQRDGLMSVCGFPVITGCQCVEGRCRAKDDGEAPVR